MCSSQYHLHLDLVCLCCLVPSEQEKLERMTPSMCRWKPDEMKLYVLVIRTVEMEVQRVQSLEFQNTWKGWFEYSGSWCPSDLNRFCLLSAVLLQIWVCNLQTDRYLSCRIVTNMAAKVRSFFPNLASEFEESASRLLLRYLCRTVTEATITVFYFLLACTPWLASLKESSKLLFGCALADRDCSCRAGSPRCLSQQLNGWLCGTKPQ